MMAYNERKAHNHTIVWYNGTFLQNGQSLIKKAMIPFQFFINYITILNIIILIFFILYIYFQTYQINDYIQFQKLSNYIFLLKKASHHFPQLMKMKLK